MENISTSDFNIQLNHSQYHSFCKICQRTIRLGDPCWWRKNADGGVICVTCKSGAKVPNRPKPQGEQAKWTNLVNFFRESVAVGAAESMLALEEVNSYLVFGTESLNQSSESDSVCTGPGAGRVRRQVERDDHAPFSYGWPMLSFIDSDQNLLCAPIFVAIAIANIDDKGSLRIRRDSDFSVNPALLTTDGIGRALVDEFETIDDESSNELSLRENLELAAKKLSVPAESLDAHSHLTSVGPIPGVVNAAIVTIGDSAATAQLMRELDELSDRTDWRSTAAASLVTRSSSPLASKNSALPTIAPLAISHSQEEILTKSRLESLTVVTGPPGTGKSQIVVNLVSNAWIRNESILLTSTNNAAVDVAVKRANDVARGLLLRTGNKQVREQLPDQIAQLISQVKPQSPDDQSRIEGQAFRCAKARNDYLDLLRQNAEAENLQFDRINRELSASIVVSNFEVINIGEDEVARILRYLIRLSQKRFFKNLRWRRLGRKHEWSSSIDLAQPLLEWLKLRSEVSKSEIEIHYQREDIGNREDQLAALDENWRTASAELIQYRLQQNLHSSQSLLAQFAEARSSYYGTSKAIGNSLSKIKGWASTALSLHQNFPLEAGLFDYVIVDEASQCHLAYILPAAYRAKHLVIVGDANQLSPIPQLTDAQERSVARRNGLPTEDLENYQLSSARFSAFDAFSKIVGADSVNLLIEHFRSHPQIARWFNETFYQSQLRVLTDISNLQREGRVLTWLETRGEASRPGPGKGSWINLAEAEAVAEIVLFQMSLGRSIGVVTPFSAQEDLIREIIYSRTSRDVLGEVNFRVGTAHKFQGDERDTIVFSSVLAPGISKKSASWLQGGDGRRLLNVSVSRARERLIVVGHPEISQFECAILTSLQMFIRTVHEFEDNRINPQFDSVPEEKLYEAMIAVGLDPLSKVNVEGYDLDFSLVTGSVKLDIEVDGDQHYRSALGRHLGLCREDISRDRVLIKAGWQVLRIPAWECVKYPQQSAMSVLELVESIES